MAVKGVRDLDIKGKRVFFRFDFNVPLDDSGNIKDDTRIRRALPTIEYAIGQGARSILASHLGRPKGERKPEMSLRPVAAKLGVLLGREVQFVDDCVGPAVREAVEELPEGGVLLLENLRFHAEETKNDPEFSRQLASLADVYVNDAFGTAHRAHASTEGIARYVKEKAAGLLMKEELDSLSRALSNPEKPVVAIFGGAKVSDKLEALKNLMTRMDAILIGGGMANTFLRAQGHSMGRSTVEEDLLGTASEVLSAAKEKGCALWLPVDVVAGTAIAAGAGTGFMDAAKVPETDMALDIGPRTRETFDREIARAGTIVWNGPMGVFEVHDFAAGTKAVAEAVAAAPGFSVVGGGDTVRAVTQFGVADRISYISTGGGAFMEFMEGKTLPGVAALDT